MELKLKSYAGVDKTLENIKQIILRNYDKDYLKAFDKWPLEKVYNYVRSLPYVKDPENVPISDNDNIELLKSPYLMIFTNGGDCDDKAVLLGAILHRKKIPYRMAVVSSTPDKQYHHIYPEIYLRGRWHAIDPTYPLWDKNHTPSQPFYEKAFTAKKVYDWNGGKTVTFNVDGSNNISSNYLSGTGSLGGTKLAILEGDKKTLPANTLGEPITAIATIVASVGQLFSGLFAAERYQDAYNVWESAANAGPAAAAARDWPLLAINTAIVAVLGVDYMNPPWGADYCSSPGRCGNRAEWKKIQPAVETKVAEIAPFFTWIVSNKKGGGSMEEIYGWYNDYKTGGQLYQQFMQGTGINTKSTGVNIAGMDTSTLLIFGLLGTAAYIFLK